MTRPRSEAEPRAKRSAPKPRRPRAPATLWHLPFGALVEERRPRWIEVQLEALLQRESQRIDQLFTLHATRPRDPADCGRVMRKLWRHVVKVGVLEFKSISALFTHGDLYRLVACGWHWLHKRPEHAPDDMLLVLVVPAITPTLVEEVARCHASLTALGDGYHRARTGDLPLIVVELDVVSEAERDDYLRAFSHHAVQTTEVVQWLRAHTNIREGTMLDPKEVAGHEDLLLKIAQSIPLQVRLKGLTPEERLSGLKPEERLSGLKLEERLSGLKPEERLSGLKPEQAILALPDAVLRGFSKEYLATLPEDVQKAVHKRLRVAKPRR